MEAADDDIKFRQSFLFHVAFTCRIQVQFQGPQNPESIVSGSFELPVNRFDFSRLLFKLSLVDPAGDLQALRMIGDGDVLVIARHGGVRHVADRTFAVAPCAVHLEIAFYAREPGRISGQYRTRFGEGQEVLAQRRRIKSRRRIGEPGFYDFFQIRSNALQLGQ